MATMNPPSDRSLRKLSIETRHEQGYILVTLPGDLYHGALASIFGDAAAMAWNEGLNKVVVDCLGVEDALTGWPGYVCGDASRTFRDHGIACALLIGPAYVERLRVIENVAFNRAVSLRIVTGMEAALEWMRGDPLPG
jgi:hypothetical protein